MRKKLNCILLIDDDEATNYFNQIIIGKLNCTDKIVVAQSGNEALEYLKSKENGSYPCPDLIFLDINMPGMNGWEFLEAYVKLDKVQQGRIVVVILTTSLNPNDLEKAHNLREIADFMNKPLSVELVKNLLEKYFEDKS